MPEKAKLSQAEIDALLNQSAQPAAQSSSATITDEETDILGEIGNISFGSAATALSTLLQQRVEITTPVVTLHDAEHIHSDFPRPYVMVAVEYTEGLEGTNALAIELQDAKTIADLMLGGDGSNTEGELQELHLSAVAEAMNQMMGGAATSMSTIFSRPINISPPSVKFVDLSGGEQFDIGLTGDIVSTAFRLRVGDLIDSQIMQLVSFDFAKGMVKLLSDATSQESTTGSAAGVTGTDPANTSSINGTDAHNEVAAASADAVNSFAGTAAVRADASHLHAGMEQQAALSGSTGSGSAHAGSIPATQLNSSFGSNQAIFQPSFAELDDSFESTPENSRNLSLILDVSLNVTVELGRTKKPIRDILDLAPGSVVELDKLAGEPVDILVNSRRIAIGEVVVIDENFGVRVTDIISPVERVKNLQ
ncbi:flagellar motor switch phosphatase FliY [Alicyclobacillus sp. SO9]|uniref:flagellar motor switch phosphatase FliY n=1 Tax=Alicyclobacillus sp. SO9 TaxID=2665646 RepID=UPI0018E8BDEE|nr:flagellar motor switch phosphatase FliY [Alicyclobacillus sp. SO9]QQE80815.1 flagellar motor switch phosphatase FliY [Alicyclobacillus sp. SO9]